jgi:hypothetical protein
VDPFTVIILGGLAGVVVACLLLAKFYPGNGSDVLDWRPTRSPEVEAQNQVDDLEQMLEAANRRRRKRGEAELTEASLRRSVAEDVRERHVRSDEYEAEQEIAQMLEIKNRRRRAKGLPEISADEFRRDLEGGS